MLFFLTLNFTFSSCFSTFAVFTLKNPVNLKKWDTFSSYGSCQFCANFEDSVPLENESWEARVRPPTVPITIHIFGLKRVFSCRLRSELNRVSSTFSHPLPQYFNLSVDLISPLFLLLETQCQVIWSWPGLTQYSAFDWISLPLHCLTQGRRGEKRKGKKNPIHAYTTFFFNNTSRNAGFPFLILVFGYVNIVPSY